MSQRRVIGHAEINGLYDRLIALVDRYPNQVEFARAAQIDVAQVSRWMNRQHQPRSFSIMRICALLNVSADWLLLGRGEIEFHKEDRT